MKNSRGARATANLRMLEFVAKKLDMLNDEVVYVGGCTTALFISDPLSLDVRPTKDVDCIVDLVSLSEYYQFAKKLEKQGFRQSINEEVICRWYYDDIILDVMPTDEKILNFGNVWYKNAIANPINHKLPDNTVIKSVTAPYLLATKIEAFKARGKMDFLSSHDFEDIITIIAGRLEIVEEILSANAKLKQHLKKFFEETIDDNEFLMALPGHINEGPVTEQRVKVVIDRIKKIIEKK